MRTYRALDHNGIEIGLREIETLDSAVLWGVGVAIQGQLVRIERREHDDDGWEVVFTRA